MTDSQLIAPFKSGLVTSYPDFMLPADAHVEMENVHIHNGKIEKRKGIQSHGRMNNWNTNLDIVSPGISQATEAIVTVTSTSLLTTGMYVSIAGVVGMTEVNNIIFEVEVIDATTFYILNSADSTHIDSSAYTAWSSAGSVYYPSGDRIMGLFQYVNSSNGKDLLIFDTTQGSKYNDVTNVCIPLTNAPLFTTGLTNYVTGVNYQTNNASSANANNFIFTNGIADAGSSVDGIWVYNGTTCTQQTWYAGSGSTRQIKQTQWIFAIKNRVLLLHTKEGNNSYPQRARWSAGNDITSWLDDVAGAGGYVDATTGDQIVSARQVKDDVIVFFTQSVWKLSYRSDPALPFIWTKLNNFRGASGKFASLGTDDYAISVSNRGIFISDSRTSERVDQNIEDFGHNEITQKNFNRVYMGRDYNNRRIWALYNGASSIDNTNAALVFDEDSKSFSTYKVDLNVLGHVTLEKDYKCSDFVPPYLDKKCSDYETETVQDFFQKNDEVFIGGDTDGFFYTINDEQDDAGDAIATSLTTASWSPFKEQGVKSLLSYVDIYLDTNENTIIDVKVYKDTDQIPYKTVSIDCMPDIGYINDITGMTNASPMNVSSSDHGLSDGEVIYIYSQQGMEIQDDDNAFTVTVVDENNFTCGEDSTLWGTYTGGGKIYRRQYYKDKVFKRVYCGGIGYQHRINLSESSINSFVIYGYQPHFKPVSRRVI